MQKHLITLGIVLVAAIFVAGLFAFWERRSGPNPDTTRMFKNILTSAFTDDYDGFVTDCDDSMKSSVTKYSLDNLSESLQPRVKLGYDTKYLGRLKKQGYEVYLWRVHFKDGGDDLLGTLSVKNDKIGGFYLK